VFQSLSHDHRSYADQTFSSRDHGWHSLLLRRFTMHPESDEVSIPPVEEQYIGLLVGGRTLVESGGDGRWTSARSVPGTISMTAPGRPTRIRWRSVTPEPIVSLELHLPAGTTARLVGELWDRDLRQVDLPDELAATDPVLEQMMLGLMRAAGAGAPDLYAETAAEFLIVHTMVQHGALSSLRTQARDDPRVRRAQSFIRENLHLPLTLAAISAEAGISRYHFLRVFQRQTGETPHRYLTRLRIEWGQHELERTTATVSEIATRCGFASPAHFSTAFRRRTGYSPSAFRQQHRSSTA